MPLNLHFPPSAHVLIFHDPCFILPFVSPLLYFSFVLPPLSSPLSFLILSISFSDCITLYSSQCSTLSFVSSLTQTLPFPATVPSLFIPLTQGIFTLLSKGVTAVPVDIFIPGLGTETTVQPHSQEFQSELTIRYLPSIPYCFCKPCSIV